MARIAKASALSLAALALLAGCADTGPAATGTTTTGAPAPRLAFSVVTVDTQLDVSEPSILADPAGTLWIAGPTGFAETIVERNPAPATTDSALFRSTDGGATWAPVQQVPGYGRDACPGGGDSDIAAAPDGALFLIDLNLANVPIDVSLDGGATWTFNCNTSIVPGVDRQWVAASDAHVWISVNHLALGPIVYRAERLGTPADGLVFGPPVQTPVGGAIVWDPATGTLYLAGSGTEVGVSHDDGATWEAVGTGLQGLDLSASFVSLAVDHAGNVFVAGSGTDGVVVSGSSDQGQTWTNATRFKPYATPTEEDPTMDGEYGFAWVAAAGNGTVGVAWYGWPSVNETGEYRMEKAGYHVFAGITQDLLQAGPAAAIEYAQVSPTPVTTKRLCTGINLVGFVQCDQADPSKTRALGDFFETGYDLEGRFLVTYIDAEGKELAHLMVAVQTDGPRADVPAA